MDLWVVAAAAGAGYLGKHLQNLSSEKEKLVESYSKISNLRQSEPRNVLEQIWDKTCPLRRLARKGVLREPSSEQNDVWDRPLEMDQFGGDSDSLLGRDSTSESVRMEEVINVLSLSSPVPGFSGRESCPHNMEFMDSRARSSCRLCKYKLLKSRSSGHALGRFSSIESNLVKVDEYVCNSLPAPAITPMRPLLVTDANQNIGRSNDAFSLDSWHNVERDTLSDSCCSQNDAFSSVPSFRDAESAELEEQVKPKSSGETVFDGALVSSGLPSGMLLFLVGLTIGIMPEVFTYSREIKKLKEQLKHAENLVQDLQEEFNMKDKLIVKELAEDGSQLLSTKISSPFKEETTVSRSDPGANSNTSYVSKMVTNNKKAENHQSMSRIEAELEAELERLGLKMDLERTPDFAKLDPQYEVGIIQGDLKLDAALRRRYENASESESDEESGTTDGQTPPANYAVSPRELSIRLHKVIEATLEARIKELETALQNSHSKFHALESQCITSLGSAYSDGESLSTPESPHQPSGNPTDTLDKVKEGTDKMTGKDPGTNYAVLHHKPLDVPNCRSSGFITPLNI